MKILPLTDTEKFKQTALELLWSSGPNDEITANYFVVREDDTGVEFLRAIYAAGLRGAKVRLIIDSYGSLHPSDNGTEYEGRPMSGQSIKALEQIGVEIYVYNHIESTDKFAWSNIRNWERFSRRNHNKNLIFNLKGMGLRGVLIGDSQWADEHFNGEMRGHNTLILGDKIYVDALLYTEKLMRSNSLEKANLASVTREAVDFAEAKLRSSDFSSSYLGGLKDNDFFGSRECSFVYSDIEFPDSKLRYSIQRFEVELIKNAKRDLWYCTPYFAPDSELQGALGSMGRGFDHNILIGKFRHDPYLPYGVKKAAKGLLRDAVDIFEYVGMGNIHYKELLADDHVFVKTANGEGRSRFYNLDTGVIIHSKEYAQYMREHLSRERLAFKKLDQSTSYLEHQPLWSRAHKLLLRPFYYHHL